MFQVLYPCVVNFSIFEVLNFFVLKTLKNLTKLQKYESKRRLTTINHPRYDDQNPMKTEKRPLSTILSTLQQDVDKNLGDSLKDQYYKNEATPSDIKVVLDQLQMINDLSKDLEFPLKILDQVAISMFNSKISSECAIAGSLTLCNHRLRTFVQLCQDLGSISVDYPIPAKAPKTATSPEDPSPKPPFQTPPA